MIDVIDLVKPHGATKVLRGVSLTVARGEVAAIIGPSGSGKSTFLRCLNGLEPFESGSVTIDGLRFEPAGRSRDWPAMHRQICLRVGMVFQSFNLFPHRTALQNVMEAPIHVLGLSRAAAEERARGLLDRVGLSDRLHALPGSSPAASNSASRSPVPWRWSRRRSSSTSRRARSTRG